MNIRNTLRTLRDELKATSIELDKTYREQEASCESFGTKQRIAVLAVQKKKLRKRIDVIIDNICADTEHLERKSQAISVIDKANIENANLIRQRKEGAHAKQKCLNVALRKGWCLKTFPYFQRILALDSASPESLNQAKNLARRAIYERALLDNYLENSSQLLDDYAQDFKLFSDDEVSDIDATVNKVLKRSNQYFQEYEELVNKNKN